MSYGLTEEPDYTSRKILVPGDEGTKLGPGVISPTVESHKPRPERLRGRSNLPENEDSDRGEEEVGNETVLLELSAKKQSTCSAPLPPATGNTNNAPAQGGCNVVEQELEVMRDKQYLWSRAAANRHTRNQRQVN